MVQNEYEITNPTSLSISETLVPVTDLVKVFNDEAQEPTFGGTLVLGTDYKLAMQQPQTVNSVRTANL